MMNGGYCFLLGLFSIAAITGCRSAEPRIDSQNGGARAKDIAEPVLAAQKGLEIAPKNTDLLLWQKLEAETEKSLARVGIVRCTLDHAFVSCLTQGSGGSEVLIDSTESAGLRHKLIVDRKDLEFEARVIANVACDKVDASVPPYEGTDVKCRFENTRAFNEAVIGGDLAFELSSLTRGRGVFTEQRNEVTGVVSCQIVHRNINVNCSIRPVTRDGISDDAHALARKESINLSEKMVDTLFEIRRYSRESANSGIPGELAGSLRCVVDDSALAADGQRAAHCLVRM